jgi:hypothetical protein
MTDRTERRRDHALRRRVDQLLARVHEARADIVERGLGAVSGDRPATAAPGRPVGPARSSPTT